MEIFQCGRLSFAIGAAADVARPTAQCPPRACKRAATPWIARARVARNRFVPNATVGDSFKAVAIQEAATGVFSPSAGIADIARRNGTSSHYGAEPRGVQRNCKRSLRRHASVALQLSQFGSAAGDVVCSLLQGRRGVPLHSGLRQLRRQQRRTNEKYVADHLVTEFWGGAPGELPLSRLLRLLLDRRERDFVAGMVGSGSSATPVFLDVGAASYEGPDISHAMEVAQLWRCLATATPPPLVIALEPLADELWRTRQVVERGLYDSRRGEHCLSQKVQERNGERGRSDVEIRWLQLAASNTSGALLTMRGAANQASISAHIPLRTASPDYAPSDFAQFNSRQARAPAEKVRTVRLDDLVKEHAPQHARVILLKLDTEGHDWEALLGSESLIVAHRIDALVFELAGQMNSDFYILHKERQQDLATARLQELRSGSRRLAQPNLRSMVAWLELRGYASMLIGKRRLVPLSGDWWSEDFEVCFTRPEVSCWYDVLAFRAADASLLRDVMGAWPSSDS
eukprot:TRINITY_DN29319_c0_g1_i1.p1 TRINITY_DN29319_c0_g1~~TRINITY_DN29319_c0_g1_i1.p1  ORF type:complete len:525 (+),score=70.71 TRINITY_DN29319_c0_g1_i1:36-1577(+)